MLGRTIIPAIALALSLQTTTAEPLLVAAGYAGPGATPASTALGDVDVLRRDLGRIRQAGYNAVSTWIPWDEAEPRKGAVNLDGTLRLIAEAAALDLPVMVQVLTDRPPPWARGDLAAAGRFTEGVRTRLSGVRGVFGIEREASAVETLIDLRPGPSGFGRTRLAFWTAIARGDKRVTVRAPAGGAGQDLLAFGETAGVVTRNVALFGPLRPRTRGVREVTAGGGAPVEVRLLHARDVIMIIALNRAATTQAVRIAFDPDIPEAIWQNMETGATVNFVMTKGGPVLESTFAPHDALVLMTSGKVR